MRAPDGLAVYQDTGCHIAPSCLNCPLVRCIYDETPAADKEAIIRERDEEIYRMYLQRGPDTRWLAGHFGVSLRTIYRAIRQGRESKVELRAV